MKENECATAIIADAKRRKRCHYALRLYVAGMSPRSMEAVRRVSEFCKKRLVGRYELEIVDIYREPASLKADQIVAVPALIKRLPLPLCRMVGDMRDEEKLLSGLGLTMEGWKKRKDSTAVSPGAESKEGEMPGS